MADQKVTALTDEASPTNDDLLMIINDPGGTPGSKKITLANMKAFLKTYFDGLYAAAGAGVSLTIPLGESFTGATTPQPCIALNDLHQFRMTHSQQVTMGRTDGFSSGAQKYACKVIVRTTTTVNKIMTNIAKNGSPGDNINITIETDSSGSPSGTPITNGTSANISGGGLSSTLTYTAFTFSSAFTLTAGTTYWLVFNRTGSLDNNNFYYVAGHQAASAANSDYAAFAGKYYKSSAWNANDSTNGNLPYFEMIPNTTAGSYSLWQSDANVNNTNFPQMTWFEGLCTTTGSAGAAGTFYPSGVVGGFSSLLPGMDYFVSNTKGAIDIDNAVSNGMYVGKAISSTQIYVPTKGRYGFGMRYLESAANCVVKAPFSGFLVFNRQSGSGTLNLHICDSADFGTINAQDYTFVQPSTAQNTITVPIRKGQFFKIDNNSTFILLIPDL